MAAPTTARRWRTFADAVALILGVNVWVSVVLLPGSYAGVLHKPSALLVALIPLAVLLLGIWRRSDGVLLGVFPASILLPVGVAPQIAASHIYGPVRFAIVALGIVAYLFGVSFFTTFHEPAQPRSVRLLSSAKSGTSPRWARRERVYWIFTIFALIFPAALIGWVLFDPTITAFVGENYPGRIGEMLTALALGAITLSLFIYQFAFLGALRPHRTGDREILTDIALARVQAKTGKPRHRFYVAVGLALVAMVGLAVLRHS